MKKKLQLKKEIVSILVELALVLIQGLLLSEHKRQIVLQDGQTFVRIIQ